MLTMCHCGCEDYLPNEDPSLSEYYSQKNVIIPKRGAKQDNPHGSVKNNTHIYFILQNGNQSVKVLCKSNLINGINPMTFIMMTEIIFHIGKFFITAQKHMKVYQVTGWKLMNANGVKRLSLSAMRLIKTQVI